jgi:hypothetical protein
MSDYHVNNQSQPIEPAVAENLQTRLGRLADASAELDPVEERSIAEEGLDADLASWAEYTSSRHRHRCGLENG